MDDRIAQHAADIAKAATTARELLRVAEVLKADAAGLAELAQSAVDGVHKTSLAEDTIASFEAAVAELDRRTAAAKDAEASLTAVQTDLATRESAVAAREKAAGELEASLTERLEKVQVAEAALVKENADGKQSQ